MKATVKYQIATYLGTIDVSCEPDDDNEIIIAKTKQILRKKYGEFPLGYESFKITKTTKR